MGHKKSSTKSETKSESKTNPWEPAQGQLKSILSLAEQQFNKAGGLNGDWISRNMPGFTPEMQAAVKGMAESGQLKDIINQVDQITTSAGQNEAVASQVLQNFATGKENITAQQVNDLSSSLYDNDIVQAQKQQLQQESAENYAQAVQDLNQKAGAAGAMGSSRAGVSQGVMFGKSESDYNKAALQLEAQYRQEAQGNALKVLSGNQAARQAGAQQLGANAIAQGQLTQGNAQIAQNILENAAKAGNATQQQAQAQAQNEWFNKVGAQQAGQTNLQNYLAQVGSIGAMGGQSTGTNTTTNTQSGGGGGFGSVLGGISTAAGVGMQAYSMFSDAELKKNVKKTGETADGVSEYEWEWNEKGKRKTKKKGKASGVLAQQMLKEKPEAVSKVSGNLAVDYKKAGVKPRNGARAK